MSSISGCTLAGGLPGAKTHHPYENVLVTWTKGKPIHKQQIAHIKQYSNQSGLA
jgi:hypothetical protein